MTKDEEEFDKLYDALPEDVKEAMTAVDTVTILTAMQKKYTLHIDQLGELSAEVGMLMLGETKPQEFIGQIETGLRIPRETAKLIAVEVNEKIFRPVRESLMQIHKMKEVNGETEDDTVVATASAVPAGEIPEEQKIKDNAKNEMEETQPIRSLPTETKNIAENKLTDPFSLPKKPAAPDPYRETV